LEFRSEAVMLLRGSGRSVAQLARELGVSSQSLRNQSMGSKGDCFDNAVAESFFATLKKELINRRSWPKKAELRTEVFDYIEIFHNRRRRHSSLGMRTPIEYELLNTPAAA
jgi:transposase InsO family protein